MAPFRLSRLSSKSKLKPEAQAEEAAPGGGQRAEADEVRGGLWGEEGGRSGLGAGLVGCIRAFFSAHTRIQTVSFVHPNCDRVHVCVPGACRRQGRRQ